MVGIGREEIPNVLRDRVQLEEDIMQARRELEFLEKNQWSKKLIAETKSEIEYLIRYF